MMAAKVVLFSTVPERKFTPVNSFSGDAPTLVLTGQGVVILFSPLLVKEAMPPNLKAETA